jgi:hypothetical protein
LSVVSSSFRWVAIGLCLACVTQSWSQQTQPRVRNEADQQIASPRVLPLAPKELLALLPPAPVDWKVTASLATNQVTSWLVTIAHRQFDFIGRSNEAAPRTINQSSGPARATFMLIDSGYDPSVAGAFSDFKPGVQGKTEKFLYMGQPAIRMRTSDSHDSLQIYINRRFILQIEAENQQKDAVIGWAQQVHFERLNPPRTNVITSLPPQVLVATVDELNPANNHESKTTIGEHVPVRR